MKTSVKFNEESFEIDKGSVLDQYQNSVQSIESFEIGEGSVLDQYQNQNSMQLSSVSQPANQLVQQAPKNIFNKPSCSNNQLDLIAQFLSAKDAEALYLTQKQKTGYARRVFVQTIFNDPIDALKRLTRYPELHTEIEALYANPQALSRILEKMGAQVHEVLELSTRELIRGPLRTTLRSIVNEFAHHLPHLPAESKRKYELLLTLLDFLIEPEPTEAVLQKMIVIIQNHNELAALLQTAGEKDGWILLNHLLKSPCFQPEFIKARLYQTLIEIVSNQDSLFSLLWAQGTNMPQVIDVLRKEHIDLAAPLERFLCNLAIADRLVGLIRHSKVHVDNSGVDCRLFVERYSHNYPPSALRKALNRDSLLKKIGLTMAGTDILDILKRDDTPPRVLYCREWLAHKLETRTAAQRNRVLSSRVPFFFTAIMEGNFGQGETLFSVLRASEINMSQTLNLFAELADYFPEHQPQLTQALLEIIKVPENFRRLLLTSVKGSEDLSVQEKQIAFSQLLSTLQKIVGKKHLAQSILKIMNDKSLSFLKRMSTQVGDAKYVYEAFGKIVGADVMHRITNSQQQANRSKDLMQQEEQ